MAAAWFPARVMFTSVLRHGQAGEPLHGRAGAGDAAGLRDVAQWSTTGV
jgi:hypothetical protein